MYGIRLLTCSVFIISISDSSSNTVTEPTVLLPNASIEYVVLANLPSEASQIENLDPVLIVRDPFRNEVEFTPSVIENTLNVLKPVFQFKMEILFEWFTLEIRDRGNDKILLGKVDIAWNYMEGTHPLLAAQGTYGEIKIMQINNGDKELK